MNLQKENEALRQENKELKALLEKAQEQIKDLKRQLGQNSRNSNWPSSRDKVRHKRRKQNNLREKSDKKSGGQPGHKGHTLKFREEPEHIESHRPDSCQHCQQAFNPEQDAVRLQKRQVFDLPPLKLEVTEHQVAHLQCEGCGQISAGQFPEAVKGPVQYGERLKSLAVYLKVVQFVPYQRSQEMLRDLFEASVSEASLQKYVHQAAKTASPITARIKEALMGASVANFDESGFYIKGDRQWLHSTSTPTLAYYAPHPSRGNEALLAIGILPKFAGVAVHDNWSSYWKHEQCQHALCNVHHLRELNGIVENFGQKWAARFKIFLQSVKKRVDEAKAAGQTALPATKLRQIERVYRKLINLALQANPPPAGGWPRNGRGPVKKTKPRNLAERLQLRQAEVLRFAFDFRVPFDNNLAERDIRMLKVQQKISGCFRSLEGAEAFCTLRSYISTLRKQKQSVWDAVTSLFSGSILLPAGLPG